jgi:cell shape-determining protein MreD
MKWPLPLLVGYLLLALEAPVREALHLGPSGGSGGSPSLVVPFIVFVCLFASSGAAAWTALLLGLCTDLSTLRGDEALVIIGPYSLGYLAIAGFILKVRPLVVRKNPVTIVVLSVLSDLLAAFIIVFILGLRRMLFWGSWSDGAAEPLLTELWHRSVGACYTALPALGLGLIFLLLTPWFGFNEAAGRRPHDRHA